MNDEQRPSTPDVSAIVAWIENDIAAMEIEIRKLRARLAAKEQRLDYARALLHSSPRERAERQSVERVEVRGQILNLLNSAPAKPWSARQIGKLLNVPSSFARSYLEDLHRAGKVTRERIDGRYRYQLAQAGPVADPVKAPEIVVLRRRIDEDSF